jgi:glutamine amidotransferase
MTEVVVIDYGLGNLHSVRRGLEQCGATATITSDPARIHAAPRVVLPGVGAFGNAMQRLEHLGLVEVLRSVAASGKPLLGICLGMQLLLDESEEFGSHQGLSIIPGRVVSLPVTTVEGVPQKVPHIGWNELLPASDLVEWQSSALSNTQPGDAVYFVHSFMAQPMNATERLADCLFGGHRVAAVIRRGQVVGCQFHPEKSGEVGLQILRSFIHLSSGR